MNAKASIRHLYLVDGSGYIFRAYFALPPMTRPDGTPVNAVYGFTNMLIKLLADTDADAVAVIFDKGAKSFRNDFYPDYKAHRPPPPEDLIPQFELIREANPILTGTAAMRLDPEPVKAVRACLRDHLAVLGLFEGVASSAIPPEVEDLARQRDEARAARDFARADELRDAITAAGFRIEDTPDGTKVRTG